MTSFYFFEAKASLVYLYHFSDMFFLLFFIQLITRSVGRIENCRRYIARVIIHHRYRWLHVLVRYRVVIYVSSSSAEGRLASTGTTGAVCRLAAIVACSYVRLEHQEIWFGYFEGVETSLETVPIAETVQTRKHVVVHRTAAEKFPFQSHADVCDRWFANIIKFI